MASVSLCVMMFRVSAAVCLGEETHQIQFLKCFDLYSNVSFLFHSREDAVFVHTHVVSPTGTHNSTSQPVILLSCSMNIVKCYVNIHLVSLFHSCILFACNISVSTAESLSVSSSEDPQKAEQVEGFSRKQEVESRKWIVGQVRPGWALLGC